MNAANHNAPGLSNPHSTNPPHHNAPHLSNHKVVNVRHRRATSVGPRQPSPSAGPDSAPVFLIRDAATDAGVHSPQQLDASPVQHSDVISIGLIARPTARSLLSLSVAFTPVDVAPVLLTRTLGFTSITVAG